jgi:hypothetical protein
MGQPVYVAATTFAGDQSSDVLLADFTNGLQMGLHCGSFDPFAGNQGGNATAGVSIFNPTLQPGQQFQFFGFNSNAGAVHGGASGKAVFLDAVLVNRGQSYRGFSEGTAIVSEPRDPFGQDEHGVWYSLEFETIVDQNGHVVCSVTGVAVEVAGRRSLPQLVGTA